MNFKRKKHKRAKKLNEIKKLNITCIKIIDNLTLTNELVCNDMERFFALFRYPLGPIHILRRWYSSGCLENRGVRWTIFAGFGS